MEKHTIFNTYFSPLVKDYLGGNESLHDFYSFPFSMDGFRQAILQRQFSSTQRTTLVTVLEEQSRLLGKTHAAVKENISALSNEKTFTITTGHQICLMTGPLYFVFKIASAIKLTQQLQAEFPEYKFVPVYWAATEDHDFEEIQSVFLNNNKYTWQPKQTVSGATGRISTEGISDFFAELETAEGEKLSYNKIYQVFKKAWTEQPNLSAAIRKAVHDLFGHLGIVGIDADDVRFKSSCKEWIRQELKDSFSFSAVRENTENLQNAGYKTQIEPREINLFYLKDNIRERIIKLDDGSWAVNNTELRFSETELDEELENHPERFSPNVVLRPLYQEAILPNISYIGGPAEIAYWLQLKKVFDTTGTDFPVLVPRDGFLFAAEKDIKRFFELGFTADDMLRSAETNLRNFVERTHGEKLSVNEEKRLLYEIFANLKQRYSLADNNAEKSFSAIETKLKKELSKLEKKAKKFAGKKDSETSAFLLSVHEKWFPGGTLAERKDSIIEYWGILGPQPAEALVEKANPLEAGLKIIPY